MTWNLEITLSLRRTTAPLVGALLLSIAAAAPRALAADDAAAVVSPKVEVFAPRAGRGPAVIVISGNTGSDNYEFVAKDVAALGYTAFLVDGKDILARGVDGRPILRKVIADAQASASATPGKVAVLGFSQGGGAALVYATSMPETVAGVVVYYPLTRVPVTPARLVERIRVSVLMLAGGRDHYRDCCLIETAREIEAAAQAASAPLELVVYPDADHGFNHPGRGYRGADTADAWKRTSERLAQLLPLK